MYIIYNIVFNIGHSAASSYTPSAVPPPSHSEVHSHGLLQRAETCQATPHARRPRVKTRQNHGYTARKNLMQHFS